MRSKATLMALLAFAFGGVEAVSVTQNQLLSSGEEVVRLIQNGTSVGFPSLAEAFGAVTADAELVVLKDCSLTTNLVVSGKAVTIRSETGAVISPSEVATDCESVAIAECGELVLSNVVFRGFSKLGASGEKGNVFVKVAADCALRMLGGAGLEKIDNAYGTYGAVKADGTVLLEDGAFICGCHSENYGGAIYLSSKAKLTLAGGSITGCTAGQYGGGVYAAKGATVSVSGAATVAGNTQGTSSDLSNLCFGGTKLDACPLTVLDDLADAEIGVRYVEKARAELGGELAAFDAVVTTEQKASAAAAFVNDIHPDGIRSGYAAAVSEDGAGLVWVAVSTEPGEVPEDEAKIVVDRAGKTLYFADLTAALECLTGGVATVTLKDDVTLDKDGECEVLGVVTLDGAGCRIGRDNDCRVLIKGEGNALTLTNVTLTGSSLGDEKGGNRSVVRVADGGRFELADGAVIRDVVGMSTELRTTAAVSVWDAEFVMRGGSEIRDCENDCANGAGAGVIVSGVLSTFRFEGGSIRNCKVPDGTGAGVQIDNRAAFLVSGKGVIEGNVGRGGAESNVYVSDLSYLQLTDVFTGSVGYSEGIKGDTNVFGRVAEECPASLADQAASALRFHRDSDKSVAGLLVTNATDKLLVWSDAVATDESGNFYYEDAESGERYYLAGSVQPVPPPEPVTTNYPTAIAFASIERVSEAEWALVVTNRVQWCRYRLLYTDDLAKGFATTGAWEQATAEGPWETNVIFKAEELNPAYFWRAEGTWGIVPKE